MIVELNREYIQQLLPLWKKYQEFYRVKNIDEDQNKHHIEHILQRPEEGKIFLYLENNTVVGFCTLYFTYASTAATKVAILNDLFTLPENRKQGVGKALLGYAIETVKKLNIPQIRWMTQNNNDVAQQLYKDYVQPSEWLLYTIKIAD